MKVILLQDVSKIGRKDEVKEVSEGFARNFLFPKKLAVLATETELKKISVRKENREKESAKEQENYQKIAEQLKKITLNFKLKVGEKGQSFGSVTANDICEALKQNSIEVEKGWIEDEHIKTTGEKTVKIEFPQGTAGEVKIKVEAE